MLGARPLDQRPRLRYPTPPVRSSLRPSAIVLFGRGCGVEAPSQQAGTWAHRLCTPGDRLTVGTGTDRLTVGTGMDVKGEEWLIRCQHLEHTAGIQATQQFWEAGPPQPVFAEKEISTGKEIERFFKACLAILAAETWGLFKPALFF